jgi:hypothetical protein
MILSLSEFIRRWKDGELTERAGSQTHFIDLWPTSTRSATIDTTAERYPRALEAENLKAWFSQI